MITIARLFLVIPSPVKHPTRLDDHLGNTSTAESLAANEGLAANSGQEVAESREHEEHGKNNQGAGGNSEADELNRRHDAIGGGAQVVCGNLSDKGVKLAGRGADAQQERDFDEEDEKRRGSVQIRKVSDEGAARMQKENATYRARAQKMIFRGCMVKMFAMPSATQRIMERIPSLRGSQS